MATARRTTRGSRLAISTTRTSTSTSACTHVRPHRRRSRAHNLLCQAALRCRLAATESAEVKEQRIEDAAALLGDLARDTNLIGVSAREVTLYENKILYQLLTDTTVQHLIPQ